MRGCMHKYLCKEICMHACIDMYFYMRLKNVSKYLFPASMHMGPMRMCEIVWCKCVCMYEYVCIYIYIYIYIYISYMQACMGTGVCVYIYIL